MHFREQNHRRPIIPWESPMNAFQQITLTPSVLRAQERFNGRAAQLPANGEPTSPVTLAEDEIQFIQAQDSFYIASVNEDGWPYIQHRGGPVGFLKVLDPQTLGFADFRGNRQLQTTGNVSVNDKVALFLMDYANRERLKILGHAKVLDPGDHRDLAAKLRVPDYPGVVERLFVIRIAGSDWNCPQHIRPRPGT